MNVPEMKIHLTDPYAPNHVSTARQVPLRFQTMAEQIVMDLIKAQVIVPGSRTHGVVRTGFLCSQRKYTWVKFLEKNFSSSSLLYTLGKLVLLCFLKQYLLRHVKYRD